MRYTIAIWIGLACLFGATLAFAQNDAAAPDVATKPVAMPRPFPAAISGAILPGRRCMA